MSKKVILVGHCGPDNSYLRHAVASADRSIKVLSADDAEELQDVLTEGADLLLVNRELPYGFKSDTGVEFIRQLREKYPQVKSMLVSNYPEAQSAALAAGALPGFGKREIGSPKVGEKIRAALELEAKLETKKAKVE